MSRPQVPPGARVIGARPEIVINDMRIIEPASFTFQKGGCDRPYAVVRAEVVDIKHGMMWFVPFDIGFAERLHKQLGELITEHTKSKLEG
jgi:hypothetical protein